MNYEKQGKYVADKTGEEGISIINIELQRFILPIDTFLDENDFKLSKLEYTSNSSMGRNNFLGTKSDLVEGIEGDHYLLNSNKAIFDSLENKNRLL